MRQCYPEAVFMYVGFNYRNPHFGEIPERGKGVKNYFHRGENGKMPILGPGREWPVLAPSHRSAEFVHTNILDI